MIDNNRKKNVYLILILGLLSAIVGMVAARAMVRDLFDVKENAVEEEDVVMVGKV